MLRHYKKHFLNNPVHFKGATVGFEPIGNNEGIAILDDANDPDLVKYLDEHADNRRGGIVRISPEIYDSQKKSKTPSQPSLNRPGVLSKIRLHNPESLVPKSNDRPKAAAESAGAVLPPPLQSNPSGLVPLAARVPQTQGASRVMEQWKPGDPLRTDGPTLEEYVKAGYSADNYPPQGYAAKQSPQAFTPKRARKSTVQAKVDEAKAE